MAVRNSRTVALGAHEVEEADAVDAQLVVRRLVEDLDPDARRRLVGVPDDRTEREAVEDLSASGHGGGATVSDRAVDRGAVRPRGGSARPTAVALEAGADRRHASRRHPLAESGHRTGAGARPGRFSSL